MMRRQMTWLALIGATVASIFLNAGMALATDSHSSRPSAHAPIGVMGDHTHHAGEWMLSYRYMRMRMNGLRDNDDRIGANDVLRQPFVVTPVRMDMEMHMFGLMTAPIDRVTLALMVPFVSLNMDHRVMDGRKFTTRSDGIGDVKAKALIKLLSGEGHSVHAQVGFSFPTGSVTHQDRTVGLQTVRLPYPMQIGSGTFDFLPGLTYTGHKNRYSWGAQGTGEIRLDKNHAGFRQGNQYELTAWGGIEWFDWVSTSLRLKWGQALNFRGRTESINVNPSVIPTADPGRRATARLDLLAGINFIVPHGPLEGIRIAIESGLPVYQRLDGPGLETDWILTTGIQYAF